MIAIGKPRVHAPAYTEADWHERDNFATEDRARGYATTLSRMYPATPYRIVERDGRFVVEYVPEWSLRA